MHHRSKPFSRKTLPLDRRGVRRVNNRRIPFFLSVITLSIIGSYLVFVIKSLPPVIESNEKYSTQQHDKASFDALPNLPDASSVIGDFKEEFYERYGGKEAAEAMLNRGIQSYGSIHVTAERMLRAAAVGRPFQVAFSGYSVTVGRGNHFQESFPLVLEQILKEPLKKSLGIELVVKNAAIGGIPSFPYGWCLEHFLGDEADIISWDYGMNEGNGASAMESYLRRGMQLSKRPMFILVDSNRQRNDLLKKYVDMEIVKDAIRVDRGNTLVDRSVLEKPNSERPSGFRDWEQFGAPDGCPGRSPWHPKKKEHELVGRMIAMHLIEAMEYAHEVMAHIDDWKSQYAAQEESNRLVFPPPISRPASKDESLAHLLYGHPQSDPDKFVLHDISCRTSFLPALDERRVLPSIVVSGMANMNEMSDLMTERSLELYKSGWVLDVDKVERDTKRKVEKCGGLGYIDMKVALYGIPESGPLRFWLPYEGASTNPDPSQDNARTWFDDSLVICEANNKRGDQACRLDTNLSLVVGGEKADKITGIDDVGVYLKRQTCVLVEIPSNAKISPLDNVKEMDGSPLPLDVKSRLINGQAKSTRGQQRSEVGLVVDISIHGENLSIENGACCISHIIWEQHQQ